MVSTVAMWMPNVCWYTLLQTILDILIILQKVSDHT